MIREFFGFITKNKTLKMSGSSDYVYKDSGGNTETQISSSENGESTRIRRSYQQITSPTSSYSSKPSNCLVSKSISNFETLATRFCFEINAQLKKPATRPKKRILMVIHSAADELERCQ